MFGFAGRQEGHPRCSRARHSGGQYGHRDGTVQQHGGDGPGQAPARHRHRRAWAVRLSGSDRRRHPAKASDGRCGRWADRQGCDDPAGGKSRAWAASSRARVCDSTCRRFYLVAVHVVASDRQSAPILTLARIGSCATLVGADADDLLKEARTRHCRRIQLASASPPSDFRPDPHGRQQGGRLPHPLDSGQGVLSGRSRGADRQGSSGPASDTYLLRRIADKRRRELVVGEPGPGIGTDCRTLSEGRYGKLTGAIAVRKGPMAARSRLPLPLPRHRRALGDPGLPRSVAALHSSAARAGRTVGQYSSTTIGRLALLAAAAVCHLPGRPHAGGVLSVFGLADSAMVLSWLAAAFLTETGSFPLLGARGAGSRAYAAAYAGTPFRPRDIPRTAARSAAQSADPAASVRLGYPTAAPIVVRLRPQVCIASG